MDIIVASVFSFLVGLIIGFVVYLKNKKEKRKQIEEKIKQIEEETNRDIEEIEGLIDELNYVIENQKEILMRMQAPSENALHSKYKNQLVYEFQDSEYEILEILLKIKEIDCNTQIVIVDENGEKILRPIEEAVKRMEESIQSMEDKIGAKPDEVKKIRQKEITFKGNQVRRQSGKRYV